MRGLCVQESSCCHLRSASLLREHCSVSTVSLTLFPPLGTTLSLYIWRCVASSESFHMAEVHEGCGMNRSSILHRLLSDLGLTFLKSQASRFFNSYLALSTAVPASGIFIASLIGMGVCAKLEWNSFIRRCGPCDFVFFLGCSASADVHCFSFSQTFKFWQCVVSSRIHLWESTAYTFFKVCSSL